MLTVFVVCCWVLLVNGAPCDDACPRDTIAQLTACVQTHIVTPLLARAALEAPLTLPLLSCGETSALLNCSAPLRAAAKCSAAESFSVVVPDGCDGLSASASPCVSFNDCGAALPIVGDAFADVCDRLGAKCLGDKRAGNVTLTRQTGCECVEMVRSCYDILSATCSAANMALFAKRARVPFGTVCAAVRADELDNGVELTCAACQVINGAPRFDPSPLLLLLLVIALFSLQRQR